MGLSERQSAVRIDAAQAPDLLRVDDVFKIYRAADEETVALRGASLTIAAGEFVALVGRSGSGKSTLLHLIAGLDTPSAGRVLVNGSDIGRLDEEERAHIREETMGMVLQRDNLIPYLTALENVALAPRLAGRADAKTHAAALLERVGLADRADHRAATLSGGEQQRVSIAVALASDPQLLLGDEVTGELDSETAAGILDLLADLARGHDHMALLVVTHDSAVAGRAERVLRMKDGIVEAHA
jgi:putative ABC transport system ATP-binding protein